VSWSNLIWEEEYSYSDGREVRQDSIQEISLFASRVKEVDGDKGTKDIHTDWS